MSKEIKINLEEILKIQKELNEDIQNTQNITYESTKNKLHLALMAELLELCNETRCFNYWSLKKRSSDEILLEEYADVLCFSLSEFIYYNPDLTEIIINEQSIEIDNEKITLAFLNLIELFTKIKDSQTQLEFLKQFIELGYKLGYNFNNIKDAYIKKCKKNHEVQKNIREINKNV